MVRAVHEQAPHEWENTRSWALLYGEQVEKMRTDGRASHWEQRGGHRSDIRLQPFPALQRPLLWPGYFVSLKSMGWSLYLVTVLGVRAFAGSKDGTPTDGTGAIRKWDKVRKILALFTVWGHTVKTSLWKWGTGWALILGLQPPERRKAMFRGVEATQLVAFCYSSQSWLGELQTPQSLGEQYTYHFVSRSPARVGQQGVLFKLRDALLPEIMQTLP